MKKLLTILLYTRRYAGRGSEYILNSTSAQLGYTMPFTLSHAGKYRTEYK